MDYNNKSICKPHHVANLWGQQSGGVVGSPRALPFTMLSNSDSTSVMGSEKDEFRSYERKKREERERNSLQLSLHCHHGNSPGFGHRPHSTDQRTSTNPPDCSSPKNEIHVLLVCTSNYNATLL